MTALSNEDRLRAAIENDAPLVALISKWNKLIAQFENPSDPDKRWALGSQIEALEGQIVRWTPISTAGLHAMLDMAHRIATAQDLNSDSYVGDGPLVALLRRCKLALPVD